MMKVELDSEELRALIARQCEARDIDGVALVLEQRRGMFKCVPTQAAAQDCDLFLIFQFALMEFPTDVLGAPAHVAKEWLERSHVWAEITQCIEWTLEQTGSWPRWMDWSHYEIGGKELAGCNW
jgi:hypothetical protein